MCKVFSPSYRSVPVVEDTTLNLTPCQFEQLGRSKSIDYNGKWVIVSPDAKQAVCKLVDECIQYILPLHVLLSLQESAFCKIWADVQVPGLWIEEVELSLCLANAPGIFYYALT